MPLCANSDMATKRADVCSTPRRTCSLRYRLSALKEQKLRYSLDQLIGANLHLTGNREAERGRGLKIDDQLILGGRLHR